jgi:hypothetical protein
MDSEAGIARARDMEASCVWRSSDGGVTWSRTLDEHAYRVIMSGPEGICMAAGVRGRIAISDNRGITWCQCAIPSHGTVCAIASSTRNDIFAATDEPILLHSSDGGTTWTQIYLPDGGFQIVDLESPAPGVLWVLQSPATQRIELDAYYCWVARGREPGCAELDWLQAIDKLLVRQLLRTTDCGDTWQICRVPQHQFHSLRCARLEEIVLVSSTPFVGPQLGAAVFRCNSHTSSWVLISPPNQPWCCETVDSDRIWFGGYDQSWGYFSRTIDGGKSWHTQSIGANGVVDIFFTDALRGWAIVGSYGGDLVWGTLDGGQNWNMLTQPTRHRWDDRMVEGISTPFV